MGSQTVLIIDDDKEVAESIAIFLEGKGYRALKAYDANEETFSFVENEQPDMIILDIILPSCDGIDALKRLKANESTRGIPVVICSVVRQKKRVVEALDAGAVDYLTKPFEVEELFARVGSALIMREIDRHIKENERLETLRDVAQAVADEIQEPLEEIRQHAAQLRASPEIEDTENRHVVDSLTRSVQQIDQILEKFR